VKVKKSIKNKDLPTSEVGNTEPNVVMARKPGMTAQSTKENGIMIHNKVKEHS
jgi:hypothetical protein